MRFAGKSEQELGNAIDSQRLTKARGEQHERANDSRSKGAAESAEVKPTSGRVPQQLISVSRWCTEHEINTKTYYNWQRKVFVAMMEHQETLIAQPEEPEHRFAELPTPQASHGLTAAMRFSGATLEVYNGASGEIVTALRKVLSHAQ